MALSFRLFLFFKIFCGWLDDTFLLIRMLRRKLGYVRFKGVYEATCTDKDGKVKWKAKAHNGVTTVGLNHILNVQFFTTAKSATWFLGLIDLAGFSALAAADTSAAHAGWAEFTTYTPATHPIWVTTVAAAGSITNTSAAVFTITAAGTVKGFFAVDTSAKPMVAGNLWATALFSTGDQAVVINDIINVTYTVTAT
jgi:hypothetical protein